MAISLEGGYLPYHVKVPSHPPINDSSPDGIIETHTYYLYHLVSRRVYIHSSMRLEDAVDAFIEGYTGKAYEDSQYIDPSKIPMDIHRAAELLNVFFEKNGMREWEFSSVADRRLVAKLERERDALKDRLE